MTLPPAVAPGAGRKATPQLYSCESLIDGSFSEGNIPAGEYYVSVSYPGYLTPESPFAADDLLQPSADMRKRIVATIPTVAVAANRPATISVSIHRGAAISGVLRYDDGSPVPDIEVVPLRKSPDGQWAEVPWAAANNRLFPGGGTDDLGHFRIEGLGAGEYTLKVLRWAEYQTALTVYYGDVFFEKDAKSIRVGEGEESAGEDITIRLAKLHTISGSLVNASGQPINSGHIGMFAMPGNVEVASALVHEDGAVFRMELIPEGTYTLRVTDARDVSRQVVRDETDPNRIQSVRETVLQSYGDYEAPIEVMSDVPSLTLTVPARAK